MPPTAPVKRTLSLLYYQLSSKPFVCLSCRSQRNTSTTRLPKPDQCKSLSRKRPLGRYASSIAPVTSVNAARVVPAIYKELYDELAALEKDAGTYVNLSQLRLAVRGLESTDAVTRVAVLGLNGQRGAKRLVSALLADHLAPETPWEKRLADGKEDDNRGLLIRYGEEYEHDNRHPLLHTLSIPSNTLKRHKIEILVCDVIGGDGNGSGKAQIEEMDFLVPVLGTPTSASGRISMVAYPVHKAIIYGERIGGLLELPRSISQIETNSHDSMIRGVVDAQWQVIKGDYSTPNISLVNLDAGETAVAEFRQSVNNSLDYEHGWHSSNVQEVISWLIEGTSATGTIIKPTIKALLEVILKHAEKAVEQEEEQVLGNLQRMGVSTSTRLNLHSAITAWAESAHIELRNQLEVSFHSKNWRKLAWWKLFWRVDDVSMITADVLQRAWLINAEKGIIWVGGQLQQAGLVNQSSNSQSSDASKPDFGTSFSQSLPSDPVAAQEPEPETDHSILDFKPQQPWPQQIAFTRSHLLNVTVPSLHSMAQNLMLQTLSTVTLTSAVSALAYVSLSSTSLYESGVVAAVGLVWSARRLQKKWENSKGNWKGTVEEEGRKVLRDVERTFRDAVEKGGRVQLDEVAVREREVARERIRRVWKELRRLD